MFVRSLGAAAALAALAWGQPGLVHAQETTPAYTTSDVLVPVGDFALSTRLYAPVGRERYPIVLLVPGSGTERTADSVYTQILARAFAARGIGSLAYDKRGSGQSTGVFTGEGFAALGEDGAALVRYARALPQTERVGLWGISQAGWVIPTIIRESDNLAFAVLVSPGGVNPHEQVAYYIQQQTLGLGLTTSEAVDADRMHRAVALYYAGRGPYRSAHNVLESYRDRPWFRSVVTHPFWNELTPDLHVLTPEQLETAVRQRPNAFSFYRSASTFTNYARDYRTLRRLPTFVIYGADDQLVPAAVSQPVFERALRGERRHDHAFRVFPGASHDITTPEGRVIPDYLNAMTAWAEAQFAAQR